MLKIWAKVERTIFSYVKAFAKIINFPIMWLILRHLAYIYILTCNFIFYLFTWRERLWATGLFSKCLHQWTGRYWVAEYRVKLNNFDSRSHSLLLLMALFTMHTMRCEGRWGYGGSRPVRLTHLDLPGPLWFHCAIREHHLFIFVKSFWGFYEVQDWPDPHAEQFRKRIG